MRKARPDKLYHGSPNKFDKFDINKIGSNVGTTGASIGFYFTSEIEEALSYGKYVYVVDVKNLKLKKSVSNFTRKLSDRAILILMRNFLKLSDGDANYYENYDDYSYDDFLNNRNQNLRLEIENKILSNFRTSSDTEIIADFSNAGIPDELIFEVLDILGYNYTMDQYDNSRFKNSQHYILYFEPKISERLTFKNLKAYQEYKKNYE